MSVEFFPRQKEALTHLATDSPVRVLLYGGAAGGSKSFLGCAWQILRRLKYPGTRGLIGRSKLDTLKKTTLKTFFEVAQMYGLRADKHYTFNAQSNIITFHNGKGDIQNSEIFLKDLFAYPSDENFDSLGSLEITDWFIDEASQVTSKAISVVRSRVRFKLNEYNLTPKGMMTCNPSKGFLYEDFYAPWRDGVLPPDKAFVPALPGDNPYLPQAYLDELDGMPEDLRKRLRDGDWDFDISKDRIFDYQDLLIMCDTNATPTGEMYTTADIGAMGDDPSIVGVWRGLTLLKVYKFHKKLPHQIADEIRAINKEWGVGMQKTTVDSDGLGIGVYGLLKCKQFLNGSSAHDKARFENLRSECYYKLADLVRLNKIQVDDKAAGPVIVKELDAVRRKNMDKEGRLGIIPREQIIKTLGHSPDYASMMMMRMMFELKPNEGQYAVMSSR